jgi:hypothetical protein
MPAKTPLTLVAIVNSAESGGVTEEVMFRLAPLIVVVPLTRS